MSRGLAASAVTSLRTLALTAVAMLAFAANSLLCRLALAHTAIDPASFGSVRLVSGALMLAVLMRLRSPRPTTVNADWPAAIMLLIALQPAPPTPMTVKIGRAHV